VRVTAWESNPDAPAIGNVHGVLIQVLKGNVGIVYIGSSTMNKTAETDLFAKLAIPTVNNLPTFSAALTLAAAGISLKDFYIDADQANDGVTVAVLVS
jgi:hypothetical protein